MDGLEGLRGSDEPLPSVRVRRYHHVFLLHLGRLKIAFHFLYSISVYNTSAVILVVIPGNKFNYPNFVIGSVEIPQNGTGD